MKALATLLSVLFLAAGSADAEESPHEASRPVDILLLADERPVIIRLQLRVDGKPYGAGWTEFVERLFETLDADENDVLSETETRKLPTPRELVAAGMLVGTPGNVEPADHSPADGQVTREELREYFQRLGANPLSVRLVQRPGSVDVARPTRDKTPAPTSGLFAQLDRDQDGALSAEEVRRSRRVLLRFDRNDDEFIHFQEIARARVLPRNVREPAKPGGRALPRFLQLPASPRAAVVTAIVNKYAASDDDPTIRLSRVGWDSPDFARFDADKDGGLSAEELAVVLKDPVPHVELRLETGELPVNNPVTLIAARDGIDSGFHALERRAAGLKLAQSQVDFWARQTKPPKAATRATYERVFQRADADANEYLDINEARVFTDFRRSFAAMDRNQDEQVHLPELLAFVERQERLVKMRVVLTVADHGRDLAEIIDADRDLQMSPQELALTWERLQRWDTNRDGRIGQDELPHQFQVNFDRAPPPLLQARRPSPDRAKSATGAVIPAWFRKMDRNSDGVLSRREFLGKKDRFRSFDKNDDGLIDGDEATE